MNTKLLQYSWLWILIATFIVLYILNMAFTPDIVGITNLEIYYRPKGNMEFRIKKWREAGQASGDRYEMVDDLMERKILMGLNKDEIMKMLGDPSLISRKDEELIMYYMLGSQEDYPARSLFFPLVLGNVEGWTLAIHLRNGHAYSTEIKVD